MLVDSESKSAALFNYEEAHLFGLRYVYILIYIFNNDEHSNAIQVLYI